MVIISDIKAAADKYGTRMNIAISRAVGALRIVVARSELEKDPILKRIVEIAA
jgi:hypothetical protein